MTLDSQPKYPSTRSYVLKLYRDAKGEAIVGRVENMATGAHGEFNSGEQLLCWLASDLDAQATTAAANAATLP